jgi:hypothetical protein
MKEILKFWLAPALTAIIVYGVFWSYTYIKAQQQVILMLTTQIGQQCEQLGYVVPEAEK